jgi:hypothetical protein
MNTYWLANPPIYLFEPVDPAGLIGATQQPPEAAADFCPCMFEDDSWACWRQLMQGRLLPQAQLSGQPFLRRSIGARAAHTTGAHAGPSGGGDSDDGGGPSPHAAARRLLQGGRPC